MAEIVYRLVKGCLLLHIIIRCHNLFNKITGGPNSSPGKHCFYFHHYFIVLQSTVIQALFTYHTQIVGHLVDYQMNTELLNLCIAVPQGDVLIW